MLMQSSPLYRRRKRTNLIGLTLSMIAMSLGPVSYTHLTLPTNKEV